ncbi:MAG: hypothetical protein AAFX54_02945 [Pseudomonadota bacterium]
MDEHEIEAMLLFEKAADSDVRLAAREAISYFHYEDFKKHAAKYGGENRPKIKAVKQISNRFADVHFRGSGMFGKPMPPFRIPITSVAAKLRVIYMASAR